MSYESGPLEHQAGCRVIHDGYGTCRCKPPSPLTREQVDDIDGLLTAMDGESDGWFGRAESAIKLLRLTLTQQAQEIRWLTLANEMLKGCVAEEIRRLAATTTDRELALRERDLVTMEVQDLRQQLAAMTTERNNAQLDASAWEKHAHSKEQQLAAAQERVTELEEQLKHSQEDF